MSGDRAPLLNWINVSTNHPLINSVVIAFIDLLAGEKRGTWRICLTHVLNGKDKADLGIHFCLPGVKAKYAECLHLHALGGALLSALCYHRSNCLHRALWVFPVKMAGIRSSVIPWLGQAPHTWKAHVCTPQAFTACEGHLWYPDGCFTSLPLTMSWLGPLANPSFPGEYLYFHLLLPLRMMITFANLFLKTTVGEMGPKDLRKLSLRGGGIKAGC